MKNLELPDDSRMVDLTNFLTDVLLNESQQLSPHKSALKESSYIKVSTRALYLI